MAVEDLTTTPGIVALVALGMALVALAAAAVAARRLGRVRREQRAVLGEHGERDLVAHAAGLDGDVRSLQAFVHDTVERLDARTSAVEERLDGAIAFRGLVRYDAYNEMSGRQSTSLVLLDARRSGIVLSTIHHRDQARLYAKQVVEGRSTLPLSPEEEEAVRVALAGEVPDQVQQH